MTTLFGLIGKTLKHSFSQKYFREKFYKDKIKDCDYLLFELSDINEFPRLLSQNATLKGINVTIPYKQQVMPYLDLLDEKAKKIGAVNTIKITEGNKTIGYNTDFSGFKTSLEKWLKAPFNKYKALILGTGGASKAVQAALEELQISFLYVSRSPGKDAIDYVELKKKPDLLLAHKLIINTTPLGMSPNVNEAPDLAYEQVGAAHYFYDLVYNPAETLFLKRGKEKGAKTKNGLEMLQLQAEKAWEIWSS